jgi:hypothetical protein
MKHEGRSTKGGWVAGALQSVPPWIQNSARLLCHPVTIQCDEMTLLVIQLITWALWRWADACLDRKTAIRFKKSASAWPVGIDHCPISI